MDPVRDVRVPASGWRRFAVLPNVHKIAILRANGLGDFVFALPALAALRAAYPDAELVYLGAPWHATFLAGRPGPVDRVIVIPHSRGVRDPDDVEDADDPNALARFFAEMRGEGFDLAIQLHGGGRYSNPFTRRLGAAVAVGMRTPDAEPLDRWLPYIYFQHEILRYLEVAALVGAPAVTLRPHLAVTHADLEEARVLVPEADRPVVVLHPGAGDPRRRWSPEKFAQIGDALAEVGARVVVIGTGDECEVVETVLDEMAAPGLNACDRLSLGGLAGLLSCCRVVVSNDSGPIHLAEAVGAATVGIYWCNNVILAAPLTRARHRIAVSWRLACPVCGVDAIHGRCDHRASFVAEVPVDEVRSAALDLFHTEAEAPVWESPVRQAPDQAPRCVL